MRPVSSDVAACNRVSCRLRDILAEQGLFTTLEEISGRQILYVSTGPAKTPDYLFSAHLDVVPAIREEQFTPREENGRLYGRGAADCLGNAMAIVSALIRANGKTSSGAIFNSDEEIGGATVPVMLKRGYSARKAVVVSDHHEDYGITYREKGILNVKLTAHGKGGHAAYLANPADNPLDKLAKAYLAIRAGWTNPADRDDWKDSLNGTMLSAGAAVNQVPETATVHLNIRYTTPGGVPAILEKLKVLIASDDIEIQPSPGCEPVTSRQDAPEMLRFKQCSEKVFNHPFRFTGMCGATDARHYSVLPVPIIISGVKTSGSHSSSEYVEVESIWQYAEIYRLFMTGEA